DSMTACDPDEIAWLRADLARLVDEARAHRPAPRPPASRRPVLSPASSRPAPPSRPDTPDTPAAGDRARRRGLLARWRHRTARTARTASRP
ncbi:DUF6397 family protein, partial [Streptomyces pseudogriseolus]|uniref:DUF6397 family protein n=1 Tax=Streptomyces pseudogriseolus TaxID=36817 RepID=UPI0036469BB3